MFGVVDGDMSIMMMMMMMIMMRMMIMMMMMTTIIVTKLYNITALKNFGIHTYIQD